MNPFPLNRILALTNSRRIDQIDWKSAEIHPNFDDITCRSRIFRNNGRLSFGKAVEQTRFSGIRRAGNQDGKTVTDQLRAIMARSKNLKFGLNCCQTRS